MGGRAAALFLPVLAMLGACAIAGDPPIATHVDDWRDEVIYEVLVDRFANGDPDNDWVGAIGTEPGDLGRWQGGDWVGLRRHLGYLQDLGVTTLWISPVVDNVERTDYQDGYHGYWASDFTRTNPHFGSLDDLRALVAAAHRRNMKVIVDIVANHTGRVFYYDFNDNGAMDPGEAEPPFSKDGRYDAPLGWLVDPPRVFVGSDGETRALGPDDFHRRGQFSDGSSEQKELGDFPTGLRDLDTENDAVVQAMIDTYARWVEMTDIDGYRLDAVPHAPHSYWSRFASGLRERLAAMGKERFLLLGEVFDGDPTKLAGYTVSGGLDSVFDFSLEGRVIENFILDGFAASKEAPALQSYREYYPTQAQPEGIGLSPWQARVAFADNHDIPRLRYWLDDPYAAELAMTVVFTVDAIPSVYYGTEQGFSGGWGNASREVLWKSGFSEGNRTFRHIAHLAKIRRHSEALRRGQLRVVYASTISARDHGPGSGLLAWERFTDNDRVLVAINGHPTDRAEARVPTGFAPGTELVDQLTDGARTVRVDADGTVAVSIPPREALILVPR